MKTMGMAILAAGLLAGSTGAFAADRDPASINVSTAGADREQVAIRVSTDGVDFADANSVASFRRDLNRQINAVCNPGDRLNADMSPDFTCRHQMIASAEPSIQKLVMDATGMNYASID